MNITSTDIEGGFPREDDMPELDTIRLLGFNHCSQTFQVFVTMDTEDMVDSDNIICNSYSKVRTSQWDICYTLYTDIKLC